MREKAYHEKVNNRNEVHLRELCAKLPVFCKQFFKPPCVAVVALSFTEVNNFSGNRADIVWGQEIPQSVDHQIFYVLFSNRLFVTGFVPAVGHTLIIVIFPLCLHCFVRIKVTS